MQAVENNRYWYEYIKKCTKENNTGQLAFWLERFPPSYHIELERDYANFIEGNFTYNDPNNFSPIYYAVTSKNIEHTRLLCSYGASSNNKYLISETYQSLIDLAANNKDIPMMQLLISHGAKFTHAHFDLIKNASVNHLEEGEKSIYYRQLHAHILGNCLQPYLATSKQDTEFENLFLDLSEKINKTEKFNYQNTASNYCFNYVDMWYKYNPKNIYSSTLNLSKVNDTKLSWFNLHFGKPSNLNQADLSKQIASQKNISGKRSREELLDETEHDSKRQKKTSDFERKSVSPTSTSQVAFFQNANADDIKTHTPEPNTTNGIKSEDINHHRHFLQSPKGI